MSILLKVLLLTYCLIIPGIYDAADTIDTAHSIRDGETIISSGRMFELGFFSPGSSTNRYVGIWFQNVSVKTVVWVANREVPILNKTGVFKLTETGILVVQNGTNGTVIWSSNATSTAMNPVAQLLDTGNLVVSDGANYLWESFEHPTDTYIPGMKIGRNLVTGWDTYLTSWKSNEDPARGDYICYMDLKGYPQLYIKKNETVEIRVGPWNGLLFRWRTFGPRDPSVKPVMVMNAEEVSYMVETVNKSVFTRFILSQAGSFQRLTWDGQAKEWRTYMVAPDECDQYKLCGAYGFCNIGGSPLCACLDKFVPRNPESWVRADWSSGCIRRANLSCKGDGFVRYSGLKLPEARNALHTERLTLAECREECLRNCSCKAYSQLDLRTRSGCLFWYEEDLIDMRNIGDQGQHIYIRMAASELDSGGKKTGILIGSSTSAVAMLIIIVALCLFLYVRKRKNKSKANKGGYDGVQDENLKLPFFKYSVIVKATENFADKNKLGEGGFGPVFKGILEDGQEIAVKRPSSTSSQGINEFKNEAIFIAKLQHRNLVRLLGCCIHREQNMLIYEYMHHRGLNAVLFDKKRSVLLDWPKRFSIINGIARGLLYLHEDSRLRIIHRDLKASNVLLDSDFNPKISDFGTARSSPGNGTTTKTSRIIGTYGYMSPEYAIDGLFSVKSDVFSFGVLILEIISGKRNREFSHSDHDLNLLGHAWMLYKEERSLELADKSLGSGFDIPEMLRTVHVGLLCVQKRLEDRPTMSSVVLMLGNEGALPHVNQPGYFKERDIANDQSSGRSRSSTNEITITMPEGR